MTVGFLVMGTGFFLQSAYFSKKAYESSNWPVTKATILRCAVASISSTRYTIDVEFEYVVHGQKLRGDRYSWEDVHFTKRKAEEVAKQLLLSETIDVSYSPESPSEAVVRPGMSWHGWKSILISISGIAVGCGLAFVRHRLERGSSQLTTQE